LPTPSTHTLRIIDAALNRAGEGLRVVEDYARFALDDPLLTRHAKALRHDLTVAAAAISPADRHAARETMRDVGTTVTTPAERIRSDAHGVCAASFKRTEQSLRSLEEYGKLVDVGFAAQVETLRYQLYTLEKAIDVGRSSRDRLEDVRLCVLIDGRTSSDEFDRLVTAIVDARVGMIQLRDKKLDDRDLVERARRLRQLTRGTRSLAVVNDRADIAALVKADGVHLGQEDLCVKDARTIVGTRTLIGVSTHNLEQAHAAVLDGANYLGAGPTFPSHTKKFDHFPGLDYLRTVATEIRLPTFAIGGIDSNNLPDVLATGVSRAAFSRAITETKNPYSAAVEFMAILKAAATDEVVPAGARPSTLDS
jgi:thiamine-phosphate pyrophosphorylase